MISYTLLTVTTWNLENLEKTDNWQKRKKVLRKMIERINADIFLMQEIHKLDALEELLEGTIYENYVMLHTVKDDGSPYALRNLVILYPSNWSEIKIEQIHHDLVPQPVWKQVTAKPAQLAKKITWERPILHACLQHEEKKIHIINLHLKSMLPSNVKGQFTQQGKIKIWKSHDGWAEGYYIADIKRVGQALETRRLVDEIFQEEGEDSFIIVGGDFNADIGSVPFNTIVGNVQDTNNPDLSPTVMIPCEYNVPDSKRFSLYHHGKGNMLDHIAVSSAFYPYWKETSILNEILPDESIAWATDVKFPESDHAPVITYFNL